MGISEFALHNVLRTYSRQDRLGRAPRVKSGASAAPRPADQVSLSSTGRKAQWLGNLASQLVDRQHPEIAGEERNVILRNTKEELLARHRQEMGDESLQPAKFEDRLTAQYLD